MGHNELVFHRYTAALVARWAQIWLLLRYKVALVAFCSVALGAAAAGQDGHGRMVSNDVQSARLLCSAGCTFGLAFDVIGISYGTQWLWEHTGHVCLKWSDAC